MTQDNANSPLGQSPIAPDGSVIRDASGAALLTQAQVKAKMSSALLKAILALVVCLLLVVSFFIGRATAPGSQDAAGAGTAGTGSAAPGGSADGQGGQGSEGGEGGEGDTAPELQISEAETKAAGTLVAGQDYVPSQPEEVQQHLAALKRGEAGDTRALGKENAPVTMVMFSDYSCPMCQLFHNKVMPSLQPLVEDGTLRIEWRELAIFAQQYKSNEAAVGAMAAGRQGKFWEFNAATFDKQWDDNHQTWTPEIIAEMAKQAGVSDMAKFQADTQDPQLQALVDSETQAGFQVGISGTPAWIINKAYGSGAVDPQVIINTINIQKEIAK